eukprot:1269920-Karenia_brevis.AAC.1
MLGRMRDSQAGGVEGWRVAEVRELPLVILRRLAVFFDMVEQIGRWPRALERALITFTPKGD